MRILIETIPHQQQRYDTCGDWQFVDGTLHIRVSKLRSEHGELLIAVHELIEAMLCHQREIGEDEVDRFDRAWSPHSGLVEPGEDWAAPYYPEHQFACGIERILAAEMGVNWASYEREVDCLVYQP